MQFRNQRLLHPNFGRAETSHICDMFNAIRLRAPKKESFLTIEDLQYLLWQLEEKLLQTRQ
jgi:hypothetical protein